MSPASPATASSAQNRIAPATSPAPLEPEAAIGKCWARVYIQIVAAKGVTPRGLTVSHFADEDSPWGQTFRTVLLRVLRDVPPSQQCVFAAAFASQPGREYAVFRFSTWNDDLFKAELEWFEARMRLYRYGLKESPPLTDEEQARVGGQIDALIGDVLRLSKAAGFNMKMVEEKVSTRHQEMREYYADGQYGYTFRPVDGETFNALRDGIARAFEQEAGACAGSTEKQVDFVTRQLRFTAPFRWLPPQREWKPGSEGWRLAKREEESQAKAKRLKDELDATAGPETKPSSPATQAQANPSR